MEHAMNQISISCPSCGFSRQVPYDRVPAGTCTVTCPRCKTGFTFSRPTAPPQPSVPEQAVDTREAAIRPPPQPPQPPQEETPQPLPLPAGEEPAAAPQRPPRPRRERPAPKKVLPDIGTLFSRS